MSGGGNGRFPAKPVRPATLRAVLGYWLRATPVVGAQIEAGAPSDDLTAMREMFGSDFAELALLFQTDSKKRIAGMYEAVSKRDYGETIRIAHALSGSAASMGASRAKSGSWPRALQRAMYWRHIMSIHRA